MTLLSHQTGAFFGAWLGGLALSLTASYRWVWHAGVALTLLAALLSLPIRATPPRQRLAPGVQRFSSAASTAGSPTCWARSRALCWAPLRMR
jgi:hypothetical protein